MYHWPAAVRRWPAPSETEYHVGVPEGQCLFPQHPSEAEDEHSEGQLHIEGVPQAQGTGDRGLEPRKHLGSDDARIHEGPDHRADPLMGHHLRQEKERDGHQEPDMGLEVVQEGDGDSMPNGDALVDRHYQEGQPGHQGNADHPAHQEVKCGPGRVQAAPELVEGAAEDEREVFLFRGQR